MQFLLLRIAAETLYSTSMKLCMAFLVYFMIVLTLSTAFFLLVAGKPWLCLIAFPIYLVAFSKIGCLSQH
jgi:hypothetical protein